MKYILLLSFMLLSLLKTHEIRQLAPYFASQRTVKLSSFAAAKPKLSARDQDLLELWESMLTGRSAPLARWMKDQYQDLGLNHLFTPSGFHLSAVLWPLSKFFRSSRTQFMALLVMGFGIFWWIPGQAALKRMVVIKIHQQFLGRQSGFILALVLDVLVGSFQDSPLSFTYSFLFLGIIYFGKKFLFLWFFIAQSLIAYFNGESIYPLLLISSPFLNLAFAGAMPFLLLFSFPLWDWQLKSGLFILHQLQYLVELSAMFIVFIPGWEINCGILCCFCFIYFNQKRLLILGILLISFELNTDFSKIPALGKYEFIPQGHIVKIVNQEQQDVVYWSDGKCVRSLVKGRWWEKCSPKRRSTRKKLKKLSYPS